MFNSFRKIKNSRTRTIYIFFSLVLGIFVFQLFRLQIVEHKDYQALASLSQQKKFVIPAVRGEIYLDSKEGSTPLVLNETRHIVWVDPTFIPSSEEVANLLAPIIKRSERDLRDQIDADESQYLEVARDINLEDAKRIESLELSGVGFVEYSKRVYPEDELAAQIAGFVNSDGDGQYGIEQYYNEEVSGVDGQFKAVTDTRGVPLRASEDNILTDPKDGARINLTIDRSIQSKAESVLRKQVDQTNADLGSAIVMNPDTGEVVAMANYPTYVPSNFIDVANNGNEKVFVNTAVSRPYEPGSIAKIFTVATAIENGVFDANGNFYDPNKDFIDGFEVGNTTTFTGSRPTREIITNSLNTGAIYSLRQLGGGDINLEGKKKLYTSFTDVLRLNKTTQVELANETNGVIRSPEDPQSSNIGYANMTFGQGFTITLAQAASAYSSIINGGTYYSPTIIDSIEYSDGRVEANDPEVISSAVVSENTTDIIKDLSVGVIQDTGLKDVFSREGYLVGGKTGTAEIASADGTYSEAQTIGTFMGFVDNDLGDRYVIITRIDRPKISGYSGSGAAFPMFAEITDWLIDYYKIQPNEEL